MASVSSWGTPGPAHETPGRLTHGTLVPTHGTPPAAPVVMMGGADGGAAARSLASEGDGREEVSRSGEVQTAVAEAPIGQEDVPACLLLSPFEAWRVLATCCNLLCTNLAGGSEAELELWVWDAGAGPGAAEGSGLRGGGGGGAGGGGVAEGGMAGGTGTCQPHAYGDGGSGGQLYCSWQCCVAHAVFLRTRQAVEQAKQQEVQGLHGVVPVLQHCVDVAGALEGD